MTRLLALWDNVPTGSDGETAFLELYADPVRINGVSMSVADLVARARVTASALADRRTEILSEIRADGRVAVAFRISARHVGALATPLGQVDGTGQTIELQVIDLLTISDGRIEEIWMVGDYLGALGRTGAVALRAPATQ